ncbi:Thymidylate kinase, partial [Dysosmobacter welbionis]
WARASRAWASGPHSISLRRKGCSITDLLVANRWKTSGFEISKPDVLCCEWESTHKAHAEGGLLRSIALGLLLVERIHGVIDQICGHLDLPVGLVIAHEVHDVVAGALVVNDAGVAGLAGGIEAPVVELRHHLALIDLLIQAAGGVGPGILGVLIGQRGKGVLGGVAGLPLVQDVLGLLRGLGVLGGHIVLIALVILGELGGLRLDQDVAHVHRVVFVAGAAIE